MPEWLHGRVPAWLERLFAALAHPLLLSVLGAVSALGLLLSLALAPWLVTRLPPDYFSRREPPTAPARAHPVVRLAKNALGALLILLGALMLVLPGQGLLTMAAGLVLADFPGKHRLERAVLGFGPVLRAINAIRRRKGLPALRR